MKILHVVNQISQQTGGGSAVVPYKLSEAQVRLGHTVGIFTSDYKAADQPAPEGVRLIKFKGYGKFLRESCFTPGAIWADYHKWDILHLHNYRTLINWIATSAYIPYVIQAHGSCLPIKRMVTRPAHNIFWRQMIYGAKRLIADADIEVDQYLKEGGKCKQIVNIPVGVDLREYEPLPEQHIHTKTVLYLGRIEKNKGVDLLIDALKHLPPDVRLVIVGIDYGFELKARAQANQYNGRVEFVGPLFGGDKIQAYCNAGVYVMPSRYEMWGLTFMEALACGTPVVVTDKCGSAKVIVPVLGSVAECDPEDLARVINQVISSGMALRDRDQRREWVKQYSWDTLAVQYVNLYKEVLLEKAIG